jgi:hypothetical protein
VVGLKCGGTIINCCNSSESRNIGRRKTKVEASVTWDTCWAKTSFPTGGQSNKYVAGVTPIFFTRLVLHNNASAAPWSRHQQAKKKEVDTEA